MCFAKAGFNVTAVDASSEALNILNRQVVEKVTHVKIMKSDYSQDLFPEKSFDLVLSYNVLTTGIGRVLRKRFV